MSDWSSTERALLEAAQEDWGPSAELKSAVRDAVESRIASPDPNDVETSSAPSPSPSPAPSPAPSGSAIGMKALGGGLVAIGVCAVALLWGVRDPHVTMTTPAPVVAIAPPAPAQPGTVEEPAIPTAAISVGSLPNAIAQDSRPRVVAVDTLADELALLRTAQTTLREGSAADALAPLATHASRFPHGVLREERMTLQVLALCDTGQVTAARAVRTELARTAPGSSHLQRLVSSCAAP